MRGSPITVRFTFTDDVERPQRLSLVSHSDHTRAPGDDCADTF